MRIIRGVIIILLAFWAIITTVAVMPETYEYKWQVWSIVAFGPVAVFALVDEVCTRLFGRRAGK